MELHKPVYICVRYFLWSSRMSVTTPLCSFKVEQCSTFSCCQLAEIPLPAVAPFSVTLCLSMLIWNEWVLVALSLVAAASMSSQLDTEEVTSYLECSFNNYISCLHLLATASELDLQLLSDTHLFWKPLHHSCCMSVTIINECVYSFNWWGQWALV